MTVFVSRLCLAIVMVFAVSAATHAQAATDEMAARWLERPGVHALMRHALAPGTGDPEGFRLDACATQRNLDGQGRTQAKHIGERLKSLGVEFDEIRSSQWCRCMETATLMGLGPVTGDPVLNSFFRDRSNRDSQTAALGRFLSDMSDRNLLLVTHQVNITALTGVFPASGQIVFLRAQANGAIEILGTWEIEP